MAGAASVWQVVGIEPAAAHLRRQVLSHTSRLLSEAHLWTDRYMEELSTREKGYTKKELPNDSSAGIVFSLPRDLSIRQKS